MGGVCSSVSSFVSVALNALERISLCTVCAMLTCCVLFTILAVMVMGIGIGYHYCFVQNSVEAMAKAAAAAGALRSGPEASGRSGQVMRSVDKAMKRGFAHRMARREAESPLGSNNLTINSNFTDSNTFYQFAETDNSNNFTNTNNLTQIHSPPQSSYKTLTTMNFTVF